MKGSTDKIQTLQTHTQNQTLVAAHTVHNVSFFLFNKISVKTMADSTIIL